MTLFMTFEETNFNDVVRYPSVLRHLDSLLSSINKTAIPPGNLPIDSRGDPRFWDHTWTNFGDFSIINNEINSGQNINP